MRRPATLAHYTSNPAAALLYRDVIGALRDETAVVVVGGAAGTGKTQLLRALCAEQPEPGLYFELLPVKAVRFDAQIEYLLTQYGLTTASRVPSGKAQHLLRYFKEQAARGRRIVLLFDNAHLLNQRTLDAWYRLGAARRPQRGAPPCLLLLAGCFDRPPLPQPPLSPDTPSPAIAWCRLDTLSDIQTGDYVARQLRAAGDAPDRFQPAAIAAVWRYSRGALRSINCLCGAALAFAAASGSATVGAGDVRAAAFRLGLDTEPPPQPGGAAGAPTAGVGVSGPSRKPPPSTVLAVTAVLTCLGAVLTAALLDASAPDARSPAPAGAAAPAPPAVTAGVAALPVLKPAAPPARNAKMPDPPTPASGTGPASGSVLASGFVSGSASVVTSGAASGAAPGSDLASGSLPPGSLLGDAFDPATTRALDPRDLQLMQSAYTFALDNLRPGASITWDNKQPGGNTGRIEVGAALPAGAGLRCRTYRQSVTIGDRTINADKTYIACRAKGGGWQRHAGGAE